MSKETHFADSGLQEPSDDRRIVISFTKGMKNMLKKKEMHRDYAEGHNFNIIIRMIYPFQCVNNFKLTIWLVFSTCQRESSRMAHYIIWITILHQQQPKVRSMEPVST